jgi:hypothetical protein
MDCWSKKDGQNTKAANTRLETSTNHLSNIMKRKRLLRMTPTIIGILLLMALLMKIISNGA